MKIIKSAPTMIGLALLLSAAVAQKANAETITFDDIDASTETTIPDGYAGLDWSNFGVLNSSLTEYANSGYVPGTVSAPNVAYNENGTPAEFSSSTPFDLTSADITAAWNDDMSVTVEGLLGGVVVDSTTVVPSSTSPTLYTFDFSDIDEVEIISAGGIENPAYVGFGMGTQIALDDLTINGTSTPEPSTWAMMLGGLSVLAVWRLRNRKSLI